ncbi:MAG: DUF3079 domain-containing protein [Rhodoferax sp.]|uniref:DUF3079 domain-containing protein n=1 Tax=Rhodoferax sp. TaxID=50421 RepID=UPI001B403F11|nr:DUF3079 domain-containing protein [Rhodoferax sp.]MBP9150036.1 DUF3079 domain-containing protein [Rhodoferax sp.]MBP9735571.1 DUF3079 domain-containing protein [Rhodoferax sp.]
MSKKFPDNPKNPQRICWGCDIYCAADDMRCGNGSDRTPHPAELFGEDWRNWEQPQASSTQPAELPVIRPGSDTE